MFCLSKKSHIWLLSRCLTLKSRGNIVLYLSQLAQSALGVVLSAMLTAALPTFALSIIHILPSALAPA